MTILKQVEFCQDQFRVDKPSVWARRVSVNSIVSSLRWKMPFVSTVLHRLRIRDFCV